MKKDVYELTSPQKSIWLTEQFCSGTPVSNICGYMTIKEKVNFKKLEEALNLFVKENDAMRLRIFIDENDNNPKQYFSDFKKFKVEKVIIKNNEEIEKISKKIAQIPFELIENQLFYFKIFSFEDGHGGFVANFHHIISDAWSMTLLVNEVMRIYETLVKENELNLDMCSYIDYIETEKKFRESKQFQKSKQYWNQDVFGEALDLTFIKSDANKTSYQANRLEFSLPDNLNCRINEFAKENNTSAFSIFLAALGIYLSKIHSKKTAIIGSPILNRSNIKEKSTIGMFISTIPLKVEAQNEYTVLEYIKSVTAKQFSAFRNQKYPYDLLLEDLRSKYDISQNIYDVVVSYQNARIRQDKSEFNFDANWIFNGCVVNNLDIHICDLNNTGVLDISYDYKVSLFSEDEIRRLHSRIIKIINKMIDNKTISIKEIEITTEEEKEYVLNTYNNVVDEFPLEKPVYTLFEEQVCKTPDNIAISEGKKELTYEKLRKKVYSYQDYFISEGIKKGDIVCLFMDNSIELVTSILAVLSIGAAYIPIDIKYPEERVAYIFQNSKASKFITKKKYLGDMEFLQDSLLLIDNKKIPVAKKEKRDFSKLSSDDLAYIIYTSGSTGNPKGVKIKNKSLTNYICFANENYVQNEKTNFPLYSSIAFDLTVTSIFTPLISGNAIYIYKNENMELLLKQIIEDEKVQIIKLTPAHLTLLQDLDLSDSKVTKLIVGGDNLPAKLCAKITEKVDYELTIFNEYGPTEATVGCMIYKYNKNDKLASVPIGYPASNTKIYILNDNLEILPYSTEGQMYIGGECLADGYLGLDNITADRFIQSPFDKDGKLYKTGDLAKLHPNGAMEYLGRSDFQVKINGYRIEIGEIQSKLLKYKGIKDCFVNVCTLGGYKTLCAYYVSEEDIPSSKLRTYLARYLPHYMVPKYYIELNEIPLTTNGKIDKTKLPLPSTDVSKRIIKPKNEVEKILCKAFCEILEIDEISTDIDFFNYYIDSLTIIKIQTILYTYGYNINTQIFYEYPNIQLLAKYILETDYEGNEEEKQQKRFESISKISCENKKIFKNKNILLFGSTGFLGVHILYYLLKDTSSEIYCLIRPKDNIEPKDRIKSKLQYYFNIEEFSEYENRIHVIQSNILDENFGVQASVYEMLSETIDCVIDSAALVKHYGNYKDFDKVNVKGTEKVAQFCIQNNIPLHYISTMSVSGYGLVEVPDYTFTEDDFYIGQKYKENVYVRSKFEAENIILNACKKNNLIASIYRVGMITNRFSDGVFQENFSDNAFINRLLSFINLGCIPKELADTKLEFTPVDILANDIIKLLKEQPKNINVYHLYNSNYLDLSTFYNILNELNYELRLVTLEEFKEKIFNSKVTYFGITNYLSSQTEYNSQNLILDNEKTNKILNKRGLSWPIIQKDYIEKMLAYLKKMNLLN